MYRKIAEDGRVELLVVFAESGASPRFDSGFGRVIHWQQDILEGYAHTVVAAPKPQRSQAVIAELAKYAPDVVYIHVYSLDYLRAAMDWAHGKRIPVLMTTDSELLHPRPWYVNLVKRVALPWVLRKVSLILTVGDENERYFAYYGVSRDRFFRNTFSIDSEYYDRILANREAVRRSLRAKLGIAEDAVVILTVGKMIPRKAHADLIRALAQVFESGPRSAVLLIAGDGVLHAELAALAAPLGDAVRLLGFIGVDELPEYYIASDVYAHPSDFDPHPLAISEAIYCGLPIVASDRIGSVGATDDVRVGVNGWVHPVGDVPALARILAELIDDPELRAQAGKASLPLGQVHSAQHTAKLFIDAALLSISRNR